jgi:DNA-binding XRE family transcriptional regulator
MCNLMMEQRDMLTTGNQLKAARALAGIKQGDLAKAARINVATISAMEGKGAAVLTSGMDTVSAVAAALESWGVELLTGGVRLKAK